MTGVVLALWATVIVAPAGATEQPATKPAAKSTPKPAGVSAPRLSAPWLGLERESGDEIELDPIPGGGFRYEDVSGGFEAFISADGSVKFESRSQASMNGTAPEGRAWFDGFVDALQRPRGQRGRPDLNGKVLIDGFKDTMPDRDDVRGRAAAGMETVPWGPYGPGPIMLSVGTSIGGAQRGPSKKAQRDFLKKTEAMRDLLALRFREKTLDDATRQISADVVAIWRNETIPLSIRKRRIFELWDDAEAPPGGTGPLQAKLEASTSEVRRRIEAAVRRIAPVGTDDAFTREELAELNAQRKSTLRFAPYTRSPGKQRTYR